ncbi:cupin domain-containing protein [bacterium]|nr:cupin domain-containing protein [bacterium]
MKLIHYGDVENTPVAIEGASKVRMRVLISEPDGATNFRMRLFEVGPGGCTPYHKHPWEHEVFVLEGKGAAVDHKKNRCPVGPGSIVFVPSGKMHNFVNTGEQTLAFLCLVPTDEVRKWREE